jgi:hypothetical protein
MTDVKQYLVDKFSRVLKSVIQASKLFSTVIWNRRSIFAP